MEPGEHPSLWENKMKAWMEAYEDAGSNQYSEDVQILLRVKEAGDGKTLAYNTHTATFKPPVEVAGTDTVTYKHVSSIVPEQTAYTVCTHVLPLQISVSLFPHVLFSLPSPEPGSEEQEDPEGSEGLGSRLPHHRVQGQVHAATAV
jgi:hypothetical protein